MGKLDGRVALVSGGSRGIGRAIALALAGEGASVAINYFSNESAAQEVITAMAAASGVEGDAIAGRYVALQGDVSQAEQARGMVRHVIDAWGRKIAYRNPGKDPRLHRQFAQRPENERNSNQHQRQGCHRLKQPLPECQPVRRRLQPPAPTSSPATPCALVARRATRPSGR